MENYRRIISALCCIVILCLSLSACGGSPNRYNPGTPATPAGVAVTAGDGQVVVEWSAVLNCAYNVYYSTSPGVTKNNSSKIANITSLSTIVPGLHNGTTYYFAVSAINSSGESPLSNEVSASPSPLAPFGQSNLTGDWRFNILVSGASNGWMRGTLRIDVQGNIRFTSFIDNSGNTSAPSDLFATAMAVGPDGSVSQTDSTSSFHGFILDDHLYRDIMAGTASWRGGASRFVAVLLKQRDNTFISTDVSGLGSAGPSGTGSKYFIYNQMSSDSSHAWEFAFGQSNKSSQIKYLDFKSSSTSNPIIPGGTGQATSLFIEGDGTVTEYEISGISPQPVAYFKGFMSSDKTLIVGTPRDTGGSRHFLRIYQIINLTSQESVDSQNPASPRYYTLSDLAGTYSLVRFSAGPTGSSTDSHYGIMSIDASGLTGFPALTYLDSNGTAATPPADFFLAITSSWVNLSSFGAGELTSGNNPADTSLYGKLSYSKKLAVLTRTELNGRPSLFIGMKQPQ